MRVPEHVQKWPRRQAALEKKTTASPREAGPQDAHFIVTSHQAIFSPFVVVCVWAFMDASECVDVLCFACAPDLEGGARLQVVEAVKAA